MTHDRFAGGLLSLTLFLSISVLALFSPPCHGLHGHAGALPKAWSVLENLPAENVADLTSKQLHLPPADVNHLLDEYEEHLGLHLRNTKYLAPKDVPTFDALSKGSWLELPEGGALWSLRLHSDDVPSHMLLFSEVVLPEGSELVIFSEAATSGRTKCGHSCMWLANHDVPPSGKLTTVPIDGDTVTIMYYQPQPLEGEHYPSLIVLHAMQDVSRRLLPTLEARRRRSLLQEKSAVVGTYLPIDELQQNVSTIHACTPNLECYPEYTTLAEGIVAVYAVDPASMTIGLCSGSLVNAPKGNVFLLTADHCLRNKKTLTGFEFWLLIFNYNAPCNYTMANIPIISEIVQGVRLAFYNSEADVLLLSIRNAIPNYFRSYLLGFDASPDAVPTKAIGIHHPSGAPTALSMALASGITTNFPKPYFPPYEVQPSDKTHIQITWTMGVTAPGSSGSPLIDTSTGKIVGVLTGGYTSCQDRTQSDYYGRLSVAWNRGLYQYLATGMVQLQRGTHFAGPDTINTLVSDNTNVGMPNPLHGPTVGFFPMVLHFLPNQTRQNVTYYMLDPPYGNDNITVNITMLPMQGNGMDVTPMVQLQQGVFNYTPADFGKHITSWVNITDFPSPVPGNLLRFDILLNVTSTQFPGMFSLLAVKGLIQEEHRNWDEYEPIVVPQLPYYAEYPIPSPSGKAVWEFPNNPSDSEVDVVICRFPEPDDLHIGDGTVTAYRNSTFIWTQSPYDDPFGTMNCVFVPRALARAGSTYYIVVSDQDDMNAVKNISSLQKVYFGYSNESIAASIL